MGKIRNRILDSLATAAYSAFRFFFVSKKFRSLYIADYEKGMPVKAVEGGGAAFRFYTPNSVTLWRAETLFEKEPETIEWIDSFDAGDVLYDVGANVGMYTIYAGVAGRAGRIVAFEPEASSYAILNRNIGLNGLAEKVTALNLALGNVERLDHLHLSEDGAGQAKHNFGEEVDFNKEKFASPYRQGVISMTIDGLIERYGIEFPNHIKIDVDGLEKEIIEGAAKTLADPRMKSLLIEINEGLEADMLLVEEIKKRGLRLRHKKHSEMFEGTRFSKIYNYVFERGGGK